ncbi:MAG TPA: sulfatase-like hydrolase/transferase [Thermoanaerobaculia bacterium]|nr:sulfatase-like hydrolase/transferase [Thermoanaerobaculia bacterium]
MKWLIAVATAFVVACAPRPVQSPSNQTPVILISIDTLRSDHLPAYGYTKVDTPNIDALRADSILYQHAYSHVPLTLPSHVTILTGMLPADSGVHDNIGTRLGDNIPTLAELLKKNGYATGAAVSAFVLRHETGIAHGFDFYDDKTKDIDAEHLLGRIQRIGMQTLQAAQPWIDAHASQPFFFFLHLYDPHTPYEPPEPFFNKYPNHYDGEIAYADSVIGDLISDLKRNGVYEKALIILLSDHGEGLHDHGEDEHGMFVYREEIQVPLIVKLPREQKKGATVTTPVQLIDVFPTIVERTATQAPPDPRRAGQSLLAFLNGGPNRSIYSETYYPRLHFGWSDQHSLIEGDRHLIRTPDPELYDLAADQAEKKNILRDDRRAFVRMSAVLQPFIKGAAIPTGYDPEEAAKLAALGYVGSTVETKPGEVLPDPKTKLDVFDDIQRAAGLHREKKEEEALRLSDRLLTQNPRIADLWDLKSKILWNVGEPEASIEAAKEGLRQNPHSIALLFDVADLSLAAHDFDQARKHAEIALNVEPGHAHEVLAKIALEQKNYDEAEKEANLALRTVMDPAPEYMVLAGAEKGRGNLTKALDYYDRVLTAVQQRNPPTMEDAHLFRGDVLARLGRNDEAEREFRQEIADFPHEARAYSSLILLLSTEGRLDEATKLVFETFKAAPGPHTYTVIADTLVSIGDERGALFWAQQGLQRYPRDPEIRDLPAHVARAANVLKHSATAQ